MHRRKFLQHLGWGLAWGWAVNRGFRPQLAAAASTPPRLALLSDAHLRDGRASRPEAQALARAVAEIRGLRPAPELVLFAGDLVHDGNPQAFELGREILSDLPAPLAAVPGEGDGRAAAAWRRFFGEPWFSQGYGGFHLLGLHTALMPSPQGTVFAVGREQRRWLARELSRLDADTPLIVLSHAPLGEIFRPWRQWTEDGPEVVRLLAPFSQVYYFHGHVHQGAVGYALRQTDDPLANESYPLPATAWPLPSPLQGTPAAACPGLGPHGCGWGLVTLGDKSCTYQPQVWTA